MNHDNIIQNWIFGAIIALISILLYRTLRSRHTSRESRINFDDLLIDSETGRMSKPASVMFAALVVSSVVILYQTFKGALTDLSFGAYLTAWVAPTLTKIVSGDRPAKQQVNVTAEKAEVHP